MKFESPFKDDTSKDKLCNKSETCAKFDSVCHEPFELKRKVQAKDANLPLEKTPYLEPIRITQPEIQTDSIMPQEEPMLPPSNSDLPIENYLSTTSALQTEPLVYTAIQRSSMPIAVPKKSMPKKNVPKTSQSNVTNLIIPRKQTKPNRSKSNSNGILNRENCNSQSIIKIPISSLQSQVWTTSIDPYVKSKGQVN